MEEESRDDTGMMEEETWGEKTEAIEETADVQHSAEEGEGERVNSETQETQPNNGELAAPENFLGTSSIETE